MSKNENMYTKQQILDLFHDLILDLKDARDDLGHPSRRFQREGFNEAFRVVESYAEFVELDW